MKREPLMTDAYFSEAIEHLRTTIAARDLALQEPDSLKKPRIYARANFRDRVELLVSRYSAGHCVAELAADVEPIVAAWERGQGFEGAEPNDLAYLDDYVRSLWLVSLALIFKVDDGVWHRLLNCIGHQGRDGLLERLVARRTAGRAMATGLLHPAPYALLERAAASADPAEVARFLAAWYPGLSGVGWHEAHQGPNGGGFFGYWAIEAAGVVATFELDDASLQGMRYYPGDLVAATRLPA